MSYHVQDVDLDADFDELIKCLWAAWEIPYQGFFYLICPIHGTGPTARDEAIKESTARQLGWAKADPTGHWQKALSDDGKIIGGALWKVFPTNPFAKPAPSIPIYWYPEGDQRDFAAGVLKRLGMPRAEMAARPHVYLNIMFTHPDYRRQGVADELMKWGTQKADQMGVEMWLNAAASATSLYKKHGFVTVRDNDLVPTTENPSEAWSEIRDRLRLEPVFVMWRPAGGEYIEGKTLKPWEQE